MVLDIDKGKSVGRKKVEITTQGGKALGTTAYDFHEAVKEIVNNVLVKPPFVKKYRRLVDVQIVIDTTNNQLIISDNMTGWDENQMMNCMDLGHSLPTPAIMSEHGYGLKSLIPYFGELIEVRTSRDGNDYFAMRPVTDGGVLEHEVFKITTPLQRYNVKTQNWNKFKGCGSMMILDLDEEHTFTKVTKPKNLVEKLEHAYSHYIDKTIRIEVIWLKDNQVKYNTFCKTHTPVLTNERVLVGKDGKVSTENAIDKAGRLGPNELVIDEMFRCPDTDIVVDVKAGFVPYTDNLVKHFDESGDKLYDPIDFKNNIFKYGGKFRGLYYSKNNVPISNGHFSMDRNAGIIGTIDIIKGIKTANTKNGIKRTELVTTFEINLTEFLRKKGLLVRSRAGDLRIDEDEMEETLLVHYKKSPKLRQYLGIDGLETTNQFTGLTTGIADIVARKQKSLDVYQIQEIKKEGGHDLWKAAFQAISYAQELGIKDIVLIAQDEELPSDIQIKVDVWNRTGWNIRYESYAYLTNTEIFPLEGGVK